MKRNDDLLDPDEDDDEDAPEIEDHYNDPDEDDDAFDDDKLTEESYRTTFEDPENLGLDDAEDVADEVHCACSLLLSHSKTLSSR